MGKKSGKVDLFNHIICFLNEFSSFKLHNNKLFSCYACSTDVQWLQLRWNEARPMQKSSIRMTKNFQSWPICADKYQLLAFIVIIAIITINCNYCQNCKVFTYIITIIFVFTLPLSGDYRDYLAIIATIWQLSRLLQLLWLRQLSPLVGRARSCRFQYKSCDCNDAYILDMRIENMWLTALWIVSHRIVKVNLEFIECGQGSLC